MAVYHTIFLLVLLSWTAQHTLSSPMMTDAGGEPEPEPITTTTPNPRQRIPCKETECTCDEIFCMWNDGAIPADGYYIRGSTNPWSDDAFLDKYGECKSDMGKEDEDVEKMQCPKN